MWISSSISIIQFISIILLLSLVFFLLVFLMSFFILLGFAELKHTMIKDQSVVELTLISAIRQLSPNLFSFLHMKVCCTADIWCFGHLKLQIPDNSVISV